MAYITSKPLEKKKWQHRNMTKLSLTKRQVYDIYLGSVALGQNELTVWEEVDKNVLNTEPIVEAYEKSRKTIIEKYAEKGDDGKPKLINGRFYDFGKNQEKAEKLLADLAEEKVEVELYQFSKTELKGLKLVPNVMRPLMGHVVTE